jgi:enoyl-CoA hydratase
MNTANQILLVAKRGVYTRLTLNRPDVANALSFELVEALLAAFAAAAVDGTRLLALNGDGKSFCSGFDLSDLDDLSDGDLVYRLIRIETLLQTVAHAPFPTLALAHGRVFGAGADLVGACSRRIAAPGTKFRMPGLGFGVVLGTRRLAACVGRDAARDIQNECRTFDADEALEVGFLNQRAEPADWPQLIEAASQAAEVIPIGSSQALFRVTAADTRAEDMADLVNSTSQPGLKDRILAYREQTLKAAGKAKGH